MLHTLLKRFCVLQLMYKFINNDYWMKDVFIKQFICNVYVYISKIYIGHLDVTASLLASNAQAVAHILRK